MVKKLEELNLLDNFLFEALAAHPEFGAAFGRKLVEIILKRSPEKVRVVAQRSYSGSNPKLHGARLDVYLEEEQTSVQDSISWSYDIEPEKDRTLQAVPFDPFGLNRMVYTIRNTCIEEPDMPYDDGSFTMFLYTKGQRGIPSRELRQFLVYFEHTTESNACNKDLEELHEMVSQVKMDEEVELEYMKVYEREEMIRENPDKSLEETAHIL